MVTKCVQSVSFSVMLNGKPVREFRPQRGLRQGIPLFPYLFILCVEIVFELISKLVREGFLHRVRIYLRAPSISHLPFADDCVIFGRATMEEANKVEQILKKYEEA